MAYYQRAKGLNAAIARNIYINDLQPSNIFILQGYWYLALCLVATLRQHTVRLYNAIQ